LCLDSSRNNKPDTVGASTPSGVKAVDSDTQESSLYKIARKIQLNAANHAEVIDKVVRYSKGNPGAIIAMLRMAVSPKYVSQQHVKLSPLYIDFRLSWGSIHE
jgi:hypothetical protein